MMAHNSKPDLPSEVRIHFSPFVYKVLKRLDKLEKVRDALQLFCWSICVTDVGVGVMNGNMRIELCIDGKNLYEVYKALKRLDKLEKVRDALQLFCWSICVTNVGVGVMNGNMRIELCIDGKNLYELGVSKFLVKRYKHNSDNWFCFCRVCRRHVRNKHWCVAK